MALDSDLPQHATLSKERDPARWRVWLGNLPFWPRHSMRSRLQWSHLATSLVPLLLLGATLLLTSTQAERRVVERTQQTVADWAARDIGFDIGRREGELLAFGRQLPFGENQDRALLAAANALFVRSTPPPIEFLIVRLDGQQLVRISRERVYFPAELRNDSNKPYFARAVQGLTYRGAEVDERGRALLQIAVPARNAVGQVKAVVVALLDPRTIESVLQNVPSTTARSAFVVDEQGAVVFGQPASTLASSREARPEVKWPRPRENESKLVSVSGESRLIAASPITPGTWWVVTEQPASLALRDVRRSTIFLALVVGLTSIGVVVWALLLARRMTVPIRQLRDAAQLLASGHLGRTIPVTREDELGELAAEFNRMSLRLAESQRALEERNLRLQQGLTLARHIQQDLLPTAGPPSKAVRTSAMSEPASEVGGDFYTYLLLPSGGIAFVIGDASGKGVAAALVMALTSSLVEAQAPRESGPGQLLSALNAQLYPRLNASHSSVALLVAEFDPKRHRLRAANAGMIAPLLVDGAHCSYLPCYGPPLGIVPTASFVEHEVELHADQMVIFTSDGIVEARNAQGEMWGFERMEAAVRSVTGRSPETIVEHIRAELAVFTDDTEPADDMTIIASQFTGPPGVA